MAEQYSILVIEDDSTIAEVLQHNLTSAGFVVDSVNDGPTGLDAALSGKYSLVILDLNLPRMSGINICKSIRQDNLTLPLIMLTSRDSEMEKVIGLESGADDYVVKPFGMFELLARVRARLRIAPSVTDGKNAGSSSSLTCGPLLLNTQNRTASANEKKLELTRKEFDVLAYLLNNQGKVVSRSELLDYVWGTTSDAYDNAVRMLLSRLRRKLQEAIPGCPLLRVVRGVGYIVSMPNAQEISADEDEA